MAENKKSFIAYSDWKTTFDELPDEIAGKLIKHIFAYVNDDNPESDNYVVKAVFANIKNTLKRDLEKWESQLNQRREAGKRSAKVRSTKLNERSISLNETTRNSTDSVSVSVSDNVIDIKNILMSEIKISDDKKFLIVKDENIEMSEKEILHFTIAEAFRKLFIKNLKEKNAPTTHQEKATYHKYTSPIRLMLENEEATKQQIDDTYRYLNSIDGEFWKSNILSTEKLRKNITQILAKKNSKVIIPSKNEIHTPNPNKRSKF